MSSIDNFTVNPEEITYLGQGLERPECVIAEQDGALRIADNRGIYTLHRPGQEPVLIGKKRGMPNGMALDRNGLMYVADIEAENVYAIDSQGTIEIVMNSVNGAAPGAVNFVYLDDLGRLWITICTRTENRLEAIMQGIPDGYLLLKDANGIRVVAEGLRFANEVRMDASGKYLYVAETGAGHVSRFLVAPDGSLSQREVVGPSPLFPGAKIDGITFDVEGNLWVTEITQNALVVLKPDGSTRTVFIDPEAKYINLPTSVTFAGEDRRTVYIGNLRMDKVACFRSPVAGAPMHHW